MKRTNTDDATVVTICTSDIGDGPCALFDDSACCSSRRTLSFAMLGCESQPPYGPPRHTATLLARLLAAAATRHERLDHRIKAAEWTIRIKIYNAQEQDYPKDACEWNSYDGILLPGSFSAAYDTQQPWIARLQQVIQEEIVGKQRPTLGLCFGHQILAHSFPTGQAIAIPSGPRAGRYVMPTTPAGAKLFSKSVYGNNEKARTHLDLYFTHGDMVQQLPDSALTLGGNDQVPIQAAAYFASIDDATSYSLDITASTVIKPYAVTLQGHPEYACCLDLGVRGTLFPIIDAMVQGGRISPSQRDQVREDTVSSFALVQDDCIATMARVGQQLGWFP